MEEEGQKLNEGSKEQDQGPAAEEEVHWESLPLEGDTLGLASFCNCAGESPRSGVGPFKACVTF